MENQDYEKLYKKMQDDIKTLQNEFHTISGDVGTLNDGQSKVQTGMETISGNLEHLSRNISEMMDKLNTVAEEQQKAAVDNLLRRRGGAFSAIVAKPLRKLAVGTISTMMLVGGYTAEKLAGAREGLEDIIAEASYNNKMRRQNKQAGT